MRNFLDRYRPMPLNELRKFKVLKWGGLDSNVGDIDTREEVASFDDADIVSSRFESLQVIDAEWNVVPAHMVVLDIDVPAALVPSSTPGHSHLFINTPMSWETYEKLLDAMQVAGILEPGYVGASKARKCTAVRLPWISK